MATTTSSPAVPALDAIEARAAAVDAGDADPRTALGELAAAGRLALGAPGRPGGLPDMAEVVDALGRRCLATAFVVWGHRMALEYLGGTHAEAGEALAAGVRPGGSAMAAGFKARSGLAELPVRARRDGADLELAGTIPWASNLHADALVVVPVALEGEPARALVLDMGLPGVVVHPARGLLAMEATSSGRLALDGVRAPTTALLDEPLDELLPRVRRPFLVLQSSFCLGVASAAADAAGERFATPGDEELRADHDAVVHRLADLRVRRDAVAADPEAAPSDLLRLRLEAAGVARAAVAVETAVTGGRGYVATSPTARRLREVAFIPVQSPTEAHLRWDLRRSA